MRKGIVFDLDDTLFSEREFVLSGFRTADAWVKKNLGVSGFYDEACVAYQRGIRGNIFNVALEKLGVEGKPELIQNIIRAYREHEPEISLLEDAAFALNHYKKFRLGLISDGILNVQRRKFNKLGIADRFQAVVFSDEFGRENWKPSEVPYLRCMKLLKCGGNECVYIADNPEKDFVTAKKLSWLTIQILREDSEYGHVAVPPELQAEHLIHSLRELVDLI